MIHIPHTISSQKKMLFLTFPYGRLLYLRGMTCFLLPCFEFSAVGHHWQDSSLLLQAILKKKN